MNIVVVGGVAGGMSAAARLRRLNEDAHIIVLEKGEYVSFANCGLPYYVGGEIQHDWALVLQTPETLQATLNLDVRINHEAIAIDTAAQTVTARTPSGDEIFSYDELILAPGAKAFIPPIPGTDSPRIRTLRTVPDAVDLRKMIEDGAKRAVVLGAGFIGIEAVEALREQGLDVSVVELSAHVLPPLDTEIATHITKALERNGVTVFSGVSADEIVHGDREDTVRLSDGTEISADLIVMSVGVRPDTAFVEAAGIETDRGAIRVDDRGRTSAPHVWAVGDAVLSVDAVTGQHRPIALAWPANRGGRLIADAITDLDTARKIPSALGTAIVRVFDQTAAMTGANRQTLESTGAQFQTLRLHPVHHAGYFPGAQQIHLVVHFESGSGKLLGAQAVGLAGVDKRIDVLATAIRAGMTIEDLIDLDLSYSPPYGQAKDPVNFVGMVGQNLLQGTLKTWFAEDLADAQANALILDVRSPREFGIGHLAGAVNIPRTELRERLDELKTVAAGRPVRMYCYTGIPSYNSYRMLEQAGFDAATLSGGLLSLQFELPELVLEK
jgi:NADPH-dependent 2,4-dienoyl-CoA reductase/sulfur reductase-like enzyme